MEATEIYWMLRYDSIKILLSVVGTCILGLGITGLFVTCEEKTRDAFKLSLILTGLGLAICIVNTFTPSSEDYAKMKNVECLIEGIK